MIWTEIRKGVSISELVTAAEWGEVVTARGLSLCFGDPAPRPLFEATKDIPKTGKSEDRSVRLSAFKNQTALLVVSVRWLDAVDWCAAASEHWEGVSGYQRVVAVKERVLTKAANLPVYSGQGLRLPSEQDYKLALAQKAISFIDGTSELLHDSRTLAAKNRGNGSLWEGKPGQGSVTPCEPALAICNTVFRLIREESPAVRGG